MKKIGLIGLLIVSPICAAPEAQIKSTTLEQAKKNLLIAWSKAKNKSVACYNWTCDTIENNKEPVKEKLNTAGRWVALKSTIAKTWIVNNTPARVKNWFSNVKTSCSIQCEKHYQTMSNWFSDHKVIFK